MYISFGKDVMKYVHTHDTGAPEHMKYVRNNVKHFLRSAQMQKTLEFLRKHAFTEQGEWNTETGFCDIWIL